MHLCVNSPRSTIDGSGQKLVNLPWTKLRMRLAARQSGYFDLKTETKIVVDASPIGLGAMLIQHDPKASQGKIIAFKDPEKRYSQLEKEVLANVFGIERFRTYIYGLQFTFITNHKPLEYLFNKTCSEPSVCVERWRLQRYNFIIVYCKGSLNNSDYLL